MAYIEVIDTYKRYKVGENTVVANNGINFSIEKGEFVVILGPSGAGKDVYKRQTLNKAVYNFKENTNLNIYEAINLASLNPAKSIKVDYKKGSLEIGKDADIAIFNENMDCLATIVEGDTIYNKIN